MHHSEFLLVDLLDADPRFQLRAAMDAEYVAELTAALEADGSLNFPPVLVFEITGHERRKVADGFHRLAAYKAAARKVIPADVVIGEEDDLFRAALKANRSHGLRPTLDDKRHAAKAALARYPDASSRELSRLTGMSHTFFDKLRQIERAEQERLDRVAALEHKLQRVAAAAANVVDAVTLPVVGRISVAGLSEFPDLAVPPGEVPGAVGTRLHVAIGIVEAAVKAAIAPPPGDFVDEVIAAGGPSLAGKVDAALAARVADRLPDPDARSAAFMAGRDAFARGRMKCPPEEDCEQWLAGWADAEKMAASFPGIVKPSPPEPVEAAPEPPRTGPLALLTRWCAVNTWAADTRQNPLIIDATDSDGGAVANVNGQATGVVAELHELENILSALVAEIAAMAPAALPASEPAHWNLEAWILALIRLGYLTLPGPVPVNLEAVLEKLRSASVAEKTLAASVLGPRILGVIRG